MKAKFPSNWACLVAQRVKNLPAMQETQVRSLDQGDPLEKEWQPTPVFVPGEFHAQMGFKGLSLCCHQESDTTEQLTLSLFPQIKTKQNQPMNPWVKDSQWIPSKINTKKSTSRHFMIKLLKTSYKEKILKVDRGKNTHSNSEETKIMTFNFFSETTQTRWFLNAERKFSNIPSENILKN